MELAPVQISKNLTFSFLFIHFETQVSTNKWTQQNNQEKQHTSSPTKEPDKKKKKTT